MIYLKNCWIGVKQQSLNQLRSQYRNLLWACKLSAHCCVEQKQGCGLFPGINGWWHLGNWYASYNEQPYIRINIRCNHTILCGPLFKITRHSDWESWCHPLLVLRFLSSHGLAVTE